jgi:hypothetical protein
MNNRFDKLEHMISNQKLEKTNVPNIKSGLEPKTSGDKP